MVIFLQHYWLSMDFSCYWINSLEIRHIEKLGFPLLENNVELHRPFLISSIFFSPKNISTRSKYNKYTIKIQNKTAGKKKKKKSFF
jgi:hypothetical protein